MQPFQAIAAMSLNRVIGRGAEIPWHLPEDFKWFKQKTTGHVLIMGRKTYESIGRPLPNRTTVVLSRQNRDIPGVLVVSSLEAVPVYPGKTAFICGGGEIYKQALPYCTDLYLSLVKRTVEGDAFFPPFENSFKLAGKLHQSDAFDILHYRNVTLSHEPGSE